MSLSHIDANNQPTMVDVSEKKETLRQASARANVYLPDAVTGQFDGKEIHSKKGPVFQTAIIAGTMAAKQTGNLIPFCHPLMLDSIKINLNFKNKNLIEILCSVKVTGRTGVEMEALMGANIAALTVYDMCKAMSHEIRIESVELVSKTGGKSDYHIKD